MFSDSSLPQLPRVLEKSDVNRSKPHDFIPRAFPRTLPAPVSSLSRLRTAHAVSVKHASLVNSPIAVPLAVVQGDSLAVVAALRKFGARGLFARLSDADAILLTAAPGEHPGQRPVGPTGRGSPLTIHARQVAPRFAGDTRPISLAAAAGQSSIVALLLAFASSHDAAASLARAISSSDLPSDTTFAQLLGPCSSTHSTPLMAAVEARAPLVVAALLRGGADPSIADARGRTPVHAAVLNGRRDVLCTLLSKASIDTVNAPDLNGVAPLTMARDVGCVEALLAAGASRTAVRRGVVPTIFHASAIRGDLPVLVAAMTAQPPVLASTATAEDVSVAAARRVRMRQVALAEWGKYDGGGVGAWGRSMGLRVPRVVNAVGGLVKARHGGNSFRGSESRRRTHSAGSRRATRRRGEDRVDSVNVSPRGGTASTRRRRKDDGVSTLLSVRSMWAQIRNLSVAAGVLESALRLGGGFVAGSPRALPGGGSGDDFFLRNGFATTFHQDEQGDELAERGAADAARTSAAAGRTPAQQSDNAGLAHRLVGDPTGESIGSPCDATDREPTSQLRGEDVGGGVELHAFGRPASAPFRPQPKPNVRESKFRYVSPAAYPLCFDVAAAVDSHALSLSSATEAVHADSLAMLCTDPHGRTLLHLLLAHAGWRSSRCCDGVGDDGSHIHLLRSSPDRLGADVPLGVPDAASAFRQAGVEDPTRWRGQGSEFDVSVVGGLGRSRLRGKSQPRAASTSSNSDASDVSSQSPESDLAHLSHAPSGDSEASDGDDDLGAPLPSTGEMWDESSASSGDEGRVCVATIIARVRARGIKSDGQVRRSCVTGDAGSDSGLVGDGPAGASPPTESSTARPSTSRKSGDSAGRSDAASAAQEVTGRGVSLSSSKKKPPRSGSHRISDRGFKDNSRKGSDGPVADLDAAINRALVTAGVSSDRSVGRRQNDGQDGGPLGEEGVITCGRAMCLDCAAAIDAHDASVCCEVGRSAKHAQGRGTKSTLSRSGLRTKYGDGSIDFDVNGSPKVRRTRFRPDTAPVGGATSVASPGSASPDGAFAVLAPQSSLHASSTPPLPAVKECANLSLSKTIPSSASREHAALYTAGPNGSRVYVGAPCPVEREASPSKNKRPSRAEAAAAAAAARSSRGWANSMRAGAVKARVLSGVTPAQALAEVGGRTAQAAQAVALVDGAEAADSLLLVARARDKSESERPGGGSGMSETLSNSARPSRFQTRPSFCRVVAALLAVGGRAAAHAVDDSGRTLLHTAVASGAPPCVIATLLRGRVPASAVDASGVSPVVAALKRCETILTPAGTAGSPSRPMRPGTAPGGSGGSTRLDAVSAFNDTHFAYSPVNQPGNVDGIVLSEAALRGALCAVHDELERLEGAAMDDSATLRFFRSPAGLAVTLQALLKPHNAIRGEGEVFGAEGSLTQSPSQMASVMRPQTGGSASRTGRAQLVVLSAVAAAEDARCNVDVAAIASSRRRLWASESLAVLLSESPIAHRAARAPTTRQTMLRGSPNVTGDRSESLVGDGIGAVRDVVTAFGTVVPSCHGPLPPAAVIVDREPPARVGGEVADAFAGRPLTKVLFWIADSYLHPATAQVPPDLLNQPRREPPGGPEAAMQRKWKADAERIAAEAERLRKLKEGEEAAAAASAAAAEAARAAKRAAEEAAAAAVTLPPPVVVEEVVPEDPPLSETDPADYVDAQAAALDAAAAAAERRRRLREEFGLPAEAPSFDGEDDDDLHPPAVSGASPHPSAFVRTDGVHFSPTSDADVVRSPPRGAPREADTVAEVGVWRPCYRFIVPCYSDRVNRLPPEPRLLDPQWDAVPDIKPRQGASPVSIWPGASAWARAGSIGRRAANYVPPSSVAMRPHTADPKAAFSSAFKQGGGTDASIAVAMDSMDATFAQGAPYGRSPVPPQAAATGPTQSALAGVAPQAASVAPRSTPYHKRAASAAPTVSALSQLPGLRQSVMVDIEGRVVQQRSRPNTRGSVRATRSVLQSREPPSGVRSSRPLYKGGPLMEMEGGDE